MIQMFIVDRAGKLLIMHRSDKVRSAANVWSIPSGEHEIGETITFCACRELDEEYGLDAECVVLLDQYENIAGDEPDREQFHWVISLYLVHVADVTKAINKEPEKHDKMEFIHYKFLTSPSFLQEYKFHD